jgi:hypothetical protein
MKKVIVISSLVFLAFSNLFAQKYICKDGNVHLLSKTAMLTIDGKNNKASSILDSKTGDLVVQLQVRGFKFPEALLEEHFNENYMQSGTFPKADFKGKIANIATVNFTKDGEYPIDIVGKLTIHGETRDIKEKGKLVIKGGKVEGTSTMNISLANYKVKIEESYKDRIDDKVALSMDLKYDLFPTK